MKILVVTGKLAGDTVRRNASASGHDVDVRILPVSVAAFITPGFAARSLGDVSPGDYDMILLPGVVRGDVTPVEEATGIPTFKGPTNSVDIPLVLELVEEIELSKTEPASELIRGLRARQANEELEDVEGRRRELLESEGGMILGRRGRELPIGRAFPMRVIAEIVNAPTLDIGSVEKRARYYEAEGADVVDIGMLAGNPNPGIVGGLVEAVRSSVNLPVSIDTLDPSEIEAAVDAGVDLILSVDRGNMEEVAAFAAETPVVVLPSDMRHGILPEGAEERVALLKENIEAARGLGMEKIIADPVLEPALKPGLLESLRAYHLFREGDPSTPVLYGLGNVTELIDADSPGVNGILAALASEVGVNLLFVPEHSVKARRSVWETLQAAKMMYLARRRETPPKDLGIDLLLLKEKRWAEEAYTKSVERGVETVEAHAAYDLELDSLGWFKIQVDREGGLIVATHYGDSPSPRLIVKGADARSVYRTIIGEGLVGKLDHAAYLGRELAKAELALRLGRSYRQDEPLFGAKTRGLRSRGASSS